MPVLHASSNQRYTAASTAFSSAYTIEFWVYFRSDVTTGQYLFAVNSAANPTASVYSIVNMSGDKINHWIGGSAAAVRTSTNALATGRWYHIVITYDGSGNASGCLLYINGVNDPGTSSASPVAPTHDGPYSWGGRVYTAVAADDRKVIDALLHKGRVYKRVLTPTEIADRYANPGTVDYVTTYASDLVIRADFDADNTSNGVTPTTSTGTAVMTSRGPLDLPGRITDLDYAGSTSADAAGVANVTGTGPTRFTSLGDYSGCGNTTIEAGSAGPLRVLGSSGYKVGVTHGNATVSAAKYVEHATGSGPTWDNRACSIVAWLAPTTGLWSPVSAPIVSLGDPATANSAVMQLNMTTAGYPQISRSTPGTEAVVGSIQYQTSLPRFVGAACGASDRHLQVDRVLKTDGSVFTSATSTGLRVGCELGATSNFFVGDLYRVIVYGRKLHADELMALYEWGKTTYQYDEAEWALWMEGSSTAYGYNSPNGLNFLTQLGGHDTFKRVYMVSQANAGENRAHFNTGFATQGQAFATNANTHLNIVKARCICWLQPFGNDWDGVTSLSDIQTGAANNYNTIFGKIDTYYGVVSVFEPVVRTDYATDGNDEQREADAQSFMTFCAAFGTIRRRPTLLRPVDGTAAELQQVTAGPYYLGDETHLNNSGYALYDDLVERWLQEDMGLIGNGLYGGRLRRFPEASSRVARSSRFNS